MEKHSEAMRLLLQKLVEVQEIIAAHEDEFCVGNGIGRYPVIHATPEWVTVFNSFEDDDGKAIAGLFKCNATYYHIPGKENEDESV